MTPTTSFAMDALTVLGKCLVSTPVDSVAYVVVPAKSEQREPIVARIIPWGLRRVVWMSYPRTGRHKLRATNSLPFCVRAVGAFGKTARVVLFETDSLPKLVREYAIF
jgi:hypothetical protein